MSRKTIYGFAGEGAGGPFVTQLAESGSITYVGKANAGSRTSDAVWQITRLTEATSGLVTEFADANGNFDNVWDLVTTLTYGPV
jgi:hypothetical protein